jgi:formylglycine-generating enzyme required for sulfatase activity
MTGNVWEWTNDWYDKEYYKNSPRNNPTGPNSGQYRALRGGSWNNKPQLVRASFRDRNAPTKRLVNYGFRLLLPAQ